MTSEPGPVQGGPGDTGKEGDYSLLAGGRFNKQVEL